MEGAGKMVDDEELKAAMAGRGLGTPATRAQIIENLIGEQYMHREGRELIPTAKAFSLMTLLNGLGINELTQPELTGDWEWKLGRIEKGEFTRDEFMREIAEMTRHMVERAKNYDSDTIPGDFGVLTAACPRAAARFAKPTRNSSAAACDYSLWKIVAGRQFEPAEIETLITEKQIGPLTGFRNKMGRTFSAAIKLNDDLQPEFDFGQDKAERRRKRRAGRFLRPANTGQCPKCARQCLRAWRVLRLRKIGRPEPKPVTSARARSSCSNRSIPMQMKKLLAEGKTDLLKEFVSNRTRRKFSAYLVAKEGKVSFEFEKKVAKPKAPAKKKAEAISSMVRASM
jgi:DNA topoisomerase-3